MSVVIASRTHGRMPARSGWIAAAALPILAAYLFAAAPAWVMMCGLAVSIYAGLKWLSFINGSAAVRTSLRRAPGYLLLWPGMDADGFCDPKRCVSKPRRREWLAALVKLSLGGTAVVFAMRLVSHWPILAGWLAMTGIVLALHFGLFHVLSLCWRRAGVDAEPIMNAPLDSMSLSEFWGKRWNLAFRDLAHTFVFRPLVGRMGIPATTLAVFLVSGLIHDCVISIPAQGGFGGPTLYFLLQGVGLLAERTGTAKRIGLGTGFIGRLFTLAVVVGPVALLIHTPFVERVVVPMLVCLNSL